MFSFIARMRPWRLACMLLVSGSLGQVSHAQLSNKKETLQGHHAVFLSFEAPTAQEAIKDFGLSQKTLEQSLAQRLKQGGVSVATDFDAQTLILEVSIDVHKVIETNDTKVYAFISRFDALQAAQLATNRQAALATTWQAVQFGAVTPDQAELLTRSLDTNLQRFLADWHAVNDK